MLEELVYALVAAGAVEVTLDSVKVGLAYVARTRPDLEQKAKAAQASGDVDAIENVLKEVTGVILAEAGTGKIAIDGAAIAALNGATFDHQHGTITIGSTTVMAKRLVTGGGAKATGVTKIEGGTSLRSGGGTRIDLGAGASITMTGGSKIEQT